MQTHVIVHLSWLDTLSFSGTKASNELGNRLPLLLVAMQEHCATVGYGRGTVEEAYEEPHRTLRLVLSVPPGVRPSSTIDLLTRKKGDYLSTIILIPCGKEERFVPSTSSLYSLTLTWSANVCSVDEDDEEEEYPLETLGAEAQSWLIPAMYHCNSEFNEHGARIVNIIVRAGFIELVTLVRDGVDPKRALEEVRAWFVGGDYGVNIVFSDPKVLGETTQSRVVFDDVK